MKARAIEILAIADWIPAQLSGEAEFECERIKKKISYHKSPFKKEIKSPQVLFSTGINKTLFSIRLGCENAESTGSHLLRIRQTRHDNPARLRSLAAMNLLIVFNFDLLEP